MPQAQTMTLDEKLAISCEAAKLWDVGDKEGYSNYGKDYNNTACWIIIFLL